MNGVYTRRQKNKPSGVETALTNGSGVTVSMQSLTCRRTLSDGVREIKKGDNMTKHDITLLIIGYMVGVCGVALGMWITHLLMGSKLDLFLTKLFKKK